MVLNIQMLLLFSFLLMVLLQQHCIAGKEYVWRNLTDEEMTTWYSPTDLCILNTDIKNKFPQDIRSVLCHNVSRGNRRLHCGIGMGNSNNPCFGPYATARPHFRMGVDGYTNYSSKPLLEAFQRLHSQNTTLILLGDSTTRQKIQAMECELLREYPRIKANGNLWGILPCESKFTIWLPGTTRPFIIRIISVGPNSADCLKNGLNHQAPYGGVFENAAHLIARENREYKNSVFVIANLGLWYNDVEKYSRVMPGMLAWLQTVAKPINATDIAHNAQYNIKNTVVWHETYAQHWINPWNTGYFAKPQSEFQESQWMVVDMWNMSAKEFIVPWCCSPITNTSRGADWRNDIAHDLIKPLAKPKERLFPDIGVLPMASITRYVSYRISKCFLDPFISLFCCV
jgi:hypothetical protein